MTGLVGFALGLVTFSAMARIRVWWRTRRALKAPPPPPKDDSVAYPRVRIELQALIRKWALNEERPTAALLVAPQHLFADGIEIAPVTGDRSGWWVRLEDKRFWFDAESACSALFEGESWDEAAILARLQNREPAPIVSEVHTSLLAILAQPHAWTTNSATDENNLFLYRDGKRTYIYRHRSTDYVRYCVDGHALPVTTGPLVDRLFRVYGVDKAPTAQPTLTVIP